MLNSMTVRATLIAIAGAMSMAAHAMADTTKRVDIPAGDLRQALLEISKQYGADLVYRPEQVQGIRTRGAHGELTTEQAVIQLLEGTALELRTDSSGAMLIAPPPTTAPKEVRGEEASAVEAQKKSFRDRLRLAQSGNTQSTESMQKVESAESKKSSSSSDSSESEDQGRKGFTLDTITVTGTRIRGGQTPPSPVIAISAENIREEGFTDLGEVIRSIPQNFSGGQNPGVTIGAGSQSNYNVNSGSALNLRGLGPDATLTLLNGRRLSYSGFVNAVDLSVVPISALSRIEIITDGASAIYGSDAVAGVANIITKRDFDGVTASYRIGTATDGGGTERQYGLTAGTTWSTGGVIAAYEHSDIDAIFSHQRAYTQYMQGPNTLLPERSQHSGLLSLYQDIGDAATLNLDTLYTERESLKYFSNSTMRTMEDPRSRVFVVSPSLELRLPAEWILTLGGSYGEDKLFDSTRRFTPENVFRSRSYGCFCNKSESVEVNAEGPVFNLPGGDARIAMGFGHRRNDFESRSFSSTFLTEGTLSSRYAYGEVYLPLVSPQMGIGAMNRLDFTAAFRHEDYGSRGNVTTPKLGLVYQPSEDFTIKSSWGKSYKEPTLTQQYQDYDVYLYPAAPLGATGYPPEATALMTFGGNPDLNPERSESWVGSVLFHPQAVPGLELELSYFNIDYRDRTVLPIQNLSAAFSDAIYSEFVTYSPSPDLLAQVIAQAPSGLTNFSGGEYDPANVIGIVYNNYTNAARWKAKGLDLTGSYAFGLAGGEMTLRGSASWLDGQQQTSAAQPRFDTAGMIFNPPKFSARAGAVWSGRKVTVSSFVNYVGGVTNNQRQIAEELGSFTTVDLNARFSIGGQTGALSGLELALSIRNVLDREPPLYVPLFDYMVSYDSTNYSATGRFASLSVSKHW